MVKGSYVADQRAVAVIQVLEQQQQQDAGRLTRRPHRPIEHLMVAGVVLWVAAAHDAPRRAAATVRWPGVRIAPTNSTGAFRQVGLVNSVAQGRSSDTMASGRVSMAGPLVRYGSSQLTPSLYFCYILRKVQLT